MKTRLLIIIGILLSLGLTGTTFATHDPTYNHPTPIPEPSPETQEDLAKDNLREQELNARGIQTIGVGNEMGTKDAPPPPALCKSGPIPSGNWKFIDCKWVEIDSKQRQIILDEQICGSGTELVDGICHVIKSDEPTHMGPSIFLDAFFFIIIILPFFIPGSVIFVVLSKTPRYSREIRIAVCIPAILVLLYFLWALFVGVYPPGYA